MRRISLLPNTLTISLLWIPNYSLAGRAQQQVCDDGADYSLGIEDHSEAIRRRHVEDKRGARVGGRDERSRFIPSSRRDLWI